MAKSGTLRVRILGDTGPLQKSLKGIRGKVAGFAKGIAKVGVAGAAAAAGGLAAAAFKTAEYGDRVAKTSRAIGINVEALQELEFALGQYGLSQEQTTATLEKFNIRIGRAAQGEATYKDAVDSLGVSLKEQNGELRDQDKIFNDVIKGLQGLESSQERAAVAGDLFGVRNGPKLASAIEGGVEGIDELRQKAQDLGVVMDKDTAEASERFNDRLDDLKQGLGGAVRSLTSGMLPVLADKVVPAINKKVIPAIKDFMAWIGPRAKAAFKSAQAFVEQWWPVVVDAFNTVRGIVSTVVNTVRGILDRFRGGMESNSETIATWRDKAAEIFGQVRELFAAVFGAIQAIVKTAVAIISGFWERFGTHILAFAKRTFGRIMEIVSGLFEFIKGIFDLITAVLTGQWGDAWQAILDILSGAWKVIRTVVAHAWDAIKTLFGAGVAAISQVWSFLWDQLKGVLSAAWDAIKRSISNRIDEITGAIGGIVDFVRDMPGRIASAASGMWDGITDAFRSAINWIIDAWNRLEFRIPGFDPPGPGPTFGGFTLGLPDIPRLETGGEVLETGLAVVHRGERWSGTNNQFPLAAGGRAVQIVVELDGRQVARSDAFIDELGRVTAKRNRLTAGA